MNRTPQPAILRALSNALLNEVVPTLKEPVLIRALATERDVTAYSGWDAHHRRWTAQVHRPDRVETWALHLGRQRWSLEEIDLKGR